MRLAAGITTAAPAAADRVPWTIAAAVLLIVWATTPFDFAYSYLAGEVPDVAAEGEGGAARQLGVLALGGLGLWCMMTARTRLAVNGMSALVVAAFFGWAALSLFWVDSAGTGARRLFVLGCLCVGALGLTMRFDLTELARLTLQVGLATIGIGIAGEIAFGSFLEAGATTYRFAGIINPNPMAMICAITMIAALALARRPPGSTALVLLAAFALLFMILTKSRGATVGGLAAVLFVWSLTATLPQRVIGLALGAIGLSVFLFLVGDEVDRAGSTVVEMGRENTEVGSLTGRVPLWENMLEHVAERPWLGHGWGGYWDGARVLELTVRQQWEIKTAHSSWINTLVELGYVGLTLFVLGYVGVWLRSLAAHVRENGAGSFFAAGVLTCVFVNMFVETTLFATNLTNVVALAVILRIAFVRREDGHA